MFKKWLQEKTTIEEAEQEQLTQDTELGREFAGFPLSAISQD